MLIHRARETHALAPVRVVCIATNSDALLERISPTFDLLDGVEIAVVTGVAVAAQFPGAPARERGPVLVVHSWAGFDSVAGEEVGSSDGREDYASEGKEPCKVEGWHG